MLNPQASRLFLHLYEPNLDCKIWILIVNTVLKKLDNVQKGHDTRQPTLIGIKARFVTPRDTGIYRPVTKPPPDYLGPRPTEIRSGSFFETCQKSSRRRTLSPSFACAKINDISRTLHKPEFRSPPEICDPHWVR